MPSYTQAFQTRPFDCDGYTVASMIELHDTQADADARAIEIRNDHPGTISRVEVRETARPLEVVAFDDTGACAALRRAAKVALFGPRPS